MKLEPLQGVKIGQVRYVFSERQADPALEKAIVRFLELKSGEEVEYLYNRMALRGDKPNEVFVLLSGASFSGSGGSTALILRQAGADYRLITRFTLVHSPIVVLSEMHNGWHSLVWEVYGGGVKAHYAKLDFKTSSYPSNPSSAPAMAPGTTLSGTAYIADRFPLAPGTALKFKVP